MVIGRIASWHLLSWNDVCNWWSHPKGMSFVWAAPIWQGKLVGLMIGVCSNDASVAGGVMTCLLPTTLLVALYEDLAEWAVGSTFGACECGKNYYAAIIARTLTISLLWDCHHRWQVLRCGGLGLIVVRIEHIGYCLYGSKWGDRNWESLSTTGTRSVGGTEAWYWWTQSRCYWMSHVSSDALRVSWG